MDFSKFDLRRADLLDLYKFTDTVYRNGSNCKRTCKTVVMTAMCRLESSVEEPVCLLDQVQSICGARLAHFSRPATFLRSPPPVKRANRPNFAILK